MNIKNRTRKHIIVSNAKICRSFSSKAMGLMFSKKIYNFGLVFLFEKEQITSLHMFFVFYPIDVLFLDKHNKVVEIKRNFRPFEMYTPKKLSKTIIELPSGSAGSTKIGDFIEF